MFQNLLPTIQKNFKILLVIPVIIVASIIGFFVNSSQKNTTQTKEIKDLVSQLEKSISEENTTGNDDIDNLQNDIEEDLMIASQNSSSSVSVNTISSNVSSSTLLTNSTTASNLTSAQKATKSEIEKILKDLNKISDSDEQNGEVGE